MSNFIYFNVNISHFCLLFVAKIHKFFLIMYRKKKFLQNNHVFFSHFVETRFRPCLVYLDRVYPERSRRVQPVRIKGAYLQCFIILHKKELEKKMKKFGCIKKCSIFAECLIRQGITLKPTVFGDKKRGALQFNYLLINKI